MSGRVEAGWITGVVPLHNAQHILVAIREQLRRVDIAQMRGQRSRHEAAAPAGRAHPVQVHQRHARAQPKRVVQVCGG